MGFKPFKSIKRHFKKVAKTVKRHASKVWKGIKTGIVKPLAKLYGKTFGKLGPLGMIAASLILPGLGSMISAGWAAAAGAIGGSFGAGMTAISGALSTAAGAVGSAYSAVTAKMSAALSHVGGTISQGASNMWNAASQWVETNAPGLHSNLSKAGDWVAEKARSFGMETEAESILNANPELRSAANARAREQFANVTQAQKIEAVIGNQGESLLTNQQVAEQFAQTPGLAKDTILKTTGQSMANPSLLAEDLSFTTQGRAADIADPVGDKAFKKAAAEAAAKSLLSFGAPSTAAAPAFSGGAGFDFFGTQRQGLGGQGAFGGQFLTDQQRDFFQNYNSIIGQVG